MSPKPKPNPNDFPSPARPEGLRGKERLETLVGLSRCLRPSAENAETASEWDALRESDPILVVHGYGPRRNQRDGLYGTNLAWVREGEVGGRREVEVECPCEGEEEEVAYRIGKRTVYVQTDAWRGFYQTPPEVKGLVKVLDTWVCPQGHSGDPATEHQVPLERLVEGWRNSACQPPVDLWVVYGPTSNVFAVGFDIYVRKRNRQQALAYLRSEGVENLLDTSRPQA